jgi:hypothetical protein
MPNVYNQLHPHRINSAISDHFLHFFVCYIKAVEKWLYCTVEFLKNIKMNILRSWREQKIMLKRRFPNLNDEDFVLENEDKTTMFEKLQNKLGKTKNEMELILAELQLY